MPRPLLIYPVSFAIRCGLLLALLLLGCARPAEAPADAAPRPEAPKVARCTPPEARRGPGLRWDPCEPIIDSHVHITPTEEALNLALRIFDGAGVGRFVVKSGGAPGSRRYQATVAMQQAVGDRMRAFSVLDWHGIDDPDWTARQVAGLRQAKADGFVGVKVFKALGLGVRTADGALLSPEDPKVLPIYKACGDLGLIFAWHIADPVAFFDAVTPANERYDELKLAEDWSFYGKDYPSHAALMATQERVVARFPKTTFLLIHMGNNAEDLGYVDRLLERHPNVYVDTSARVPEFGRKPAALVRAFFIKHQDRILFGTDLIVGANGGLQLGSVSDPPPTPDDAFDFYFKHFRYFETAGRGMAHPTPIQGRWTVDGIDLPEAVLKKLYVTNAERLLFAPQGSPKTPPG